MLALSTQAGSNRYDGAYCHYSVDKAASQIIDCINQINELNTGQFWHSNGDQLPW